jgi:predicted SAM-dependent methyltransferase
MIRDKLPKNWIPIYDNFRFEITTSLGRMVQSFNPPKVFSPYLHVGCGNQRIQGFINTDVFGNNQADYGLDLRFELPFPDSSFQGIYTHHVVEHIAYEDARLFFQEAFRLLQPQGVLRIVVPDAGKFIQAYNQNPESCSELVSFLPEHLHSPKWKTSLQVIDHIFRDTYFNPHQSAWDFYTLKLELENSGFYKVERMDCGISTNTKMSGLDNEGWANHSIYVEAFKQ